MPSHNWKVKKEIEEAKTSIGYLEVPTDWVARQQVFTKLEVRSMQEILTAAAPYLHQANAFTLKHLISGNYNLRRKFIRCLDIAKQYGFIEFNTPLSIDTKIFVTQSGRDAIRCPDYFLTGFMITDREPVKLQEEIAQSFREAEQLVLRRRDIWLFNDV